MCLKCADNVPDVCAYLPKSEITALCGSDAVSHVKIGQKLAFVAQSARRAVFELKSAIPLPQYLK